MYFIYENAHKANQDAVKNNKEHDLNPENFSQYYFEYEPGYTTTD